MKITRGRGRNIVKIGNKTMDIPIVQGGMGIGISLGELAGAVAREGGMGTISILNIGYGEDDFVDNDLEANIRAFHKELAKAREISEGKGIIAVNMMSVITDYDELEEVVLNSDADALVVGAGLALNLPKNNVNNKLLAPIVSSKRALELIVRSWVRRYDTMPDFVIVEGPAAGGHLGFSREELENYKPGDFDKEVEEIAEYLKSLEAEHGKVPFFVAGGVLTGEDLRKYQAMGAAGIQMGTRFLASEESGASPEMKEMIVNASADDLIIIDSPAGIPGRAINNEFLKRVERERVIPKKCYLCLKSCRPATTPFCINEALINSAIGKVDEGLVFCGSRVDEMKDIKSVKEIIQEVLE